MLLRAIRTTIRAFSYGMQIAWGTRLLLGTPFVLQNHPDGRVVLVVELPEQYSKHETIDSTGKILFTLQWMAGDQRGFLKYAELAVRQSSVCSKNEYLYEALNITRVHSCLHLW